MLVGRAAWTCFRDSAWCHFRTTPFLPDTTAATEAQAWSVSLEGASSPAARLPGTRATVLPKPAQPCPAVEPSQTLPHNVSWNLPSKLGHLKLAGALLVISLGEMAIPPPENWKVRPSSYRIDPITVAGPEFKPHLLTPSNFPSFASWPYHRVQPPKATAVSQHVLGLLSLDSW